MSNLFDKQKIVRKLEQEIESLDEYFKDILLDSIRYQIKSKLSEYQYVESELFPDLYKYIGYTQAEYDSEKNIKKPNLENCDNKSANIKENLYNLLKNKTEN